MRIKRLLTVLAVLALALPLGAQMPMGGARNLSGIWHPVVGSGGAYEMTDQTGKKTQMEMSVVGKEDVNGMPAYWMEVSMADARSSGNMYVKTLMVTGSTGTTSTRMIMQQPGQQPLEMDTSGFGARGRGPSQATPSDIREKSELVGTETITVPAGTFSCQHYRMKDGSSDVWISDKVAPWGLVKSQSKDTSMMLTKVITDAQDHITGTPKKFDPSQFLRGTPPQPAQ